MKPKYKIGQRVYIFWFSVEYDLRSGKSFYLFEEYKIMNFRAINHLEENSECEYLLKGQCCETWRKDGFYILTKKQIKSMEKKLDETIDKHYNIICNSFGEAIAKQEKEIEEIKKGLK